MGSRGTVAAVRSYGSHGLLQTASAQVLLQQTRKLSSELGVGHHSVRASLKGALPRRQVAMGTEGEDWNALRRRKAFQLLHEVLPGQSLLADIHHHEIRRNAHVGTELVGAPRHGDVVPEATRCFLKAAREEEVLHEAHHTLAHVDRIPPPPAGRSKQAYPIADRGYHP